MTASPNGGSRTSHDQRRIAVTGGAAGIGGAVATLLAEHGCTVYAIDVDPHGLSVPHGLSDAPAGPTPHRYPTPHRVRDASFPCRPM